MLLAGDVGATKTNLAIYSPDAGLGSPLAEMTYPSARYPNLVSLVREFLSKVQLGVNRACIGVAGPIVEGRVTTTNLPWEIDQEPLRKALDLSAVRLLNDLEAIAQSVPLLKEDDLLVLNEGKPVAGGAIAVIAPGTGLGEAFLTWDGSCYRAHASEGGHVDFAPNSRMEAQLLDYMRDHRGLAHVSYESVCSGLGLPNIYAFLKDRGEEEEPGWLTEQLAAADDPTPVIVSAALDKTRECAICVATLDAFVSILGAEAGNLALKVLATGGVYVGGGIPPRILPVLERGRFMEALVRKGRFSGLMSSIPVRVIIHPKAALLGAAYHGLEMM